MLRDHLRPLVGVKMIPVITPVLAGLTGVMAMAEMAMAVVAEMEEMVAVMVEAVTL